MNDESSQKILTCIFEGIANSIFVINFNLTWSTQYLVLSTTHSCGGFSLLDMTDPLYPQCCMDDRSAIFLWNIMISSILYFTAQ